MRKDELMESLLSSRAYNMTDRRLTCREDKFQDIDRLARKVTPSLPEVRREHHRVKSSPLLCPIIFSPQSRFIICWEVLNIFLIYVYFMEIPITIAFQNHRSEEENQRFFQMINFPAISIFICGMFINLNTSFYEDGLLRKQPVEIRRNYMKTSFLPDLISIISILIYEIVELLKMQSRQTLKFIVILCYLKVIELMKIERTIINSFDLNRRIKAALKLFLLLMKIFLICNIVACGAFYLSDTLSNPNHLPILKPDGTVCRQECYWVLNTTYATGSLKDVNSFNVQYIYSLYWASTTMISIGYGDITPKNPYQITYTIVIQFLSCLLYAYAINTIWSIIQQLNAKKYKIHSRLNIINLYMRDKAIGPELMSRINAYLNNYYYAKNLRQRDIEAQIINELTPALKKELYFQSYSVIFSHRMFEGMSEDLIGGVSQYVRQVGYYEDQMVFLKDFAISPCLYFVRKGELIHFTGGKTQVGLKNIYTRDFVGLYEFITQISHQSILKAVKYSLTYLLKYEDWRNMLYKYSDDFQTFYQLKDEILLYDKLDKIGYRCYFCSSSLHPTDLCFDNHIRNEVINDRNNRTREDHNLRKKYVRRQFKMHFHEKQDKSKRKMTLKTSQIKLYNRLDGHHASLLHVGKQNNFEREDPRDSPRKSSVDCQVHQIRRGGRFFIRNNKSKAQNHRAIDRIRKQYANRDRHSDYSDEQSIEQEIKAVQISMDILCNYNNYYTNFNVAEFNQRDQARRRMTRSFI